MQIIRRKGKNKVSLEGSECLGGRGRQQGWVEWLSITVLSSPPPAAKPMALLWGGWDSFLAGTEFLELLSHLKRHFFHFTFSQKNVSSKKNQRKKKLLFLLLSAVSFPLGSPFPHRKLSRWGFIHHFQKTGMKIPCQQK